jgi:D-beta-D-heptose 7-phosphate kinase/D-beta-D-heptose 1-phosphate adenosyltransferase
MDSLTRRRAEQILREIAGRQVVVLGDLMLDEFLWGAVSRIAPEAPVPVVEIQRESFRLGGAGNVVNNARALRARAVPVGVTGQDAAAERLLAQLAAEGLSADGIVADPSRPTTVKTRVIAHNQLVVRTDRERRAPLEPAVEQQVLERFTALAARANAVIISDYDKGALTPRVLAYALQFARERGIPVCVDPKIRHFACYRTATVITPNHHEAARVTASVIESQEDLVRAGQRIRETLDCGSVLITRGEGGMALFSADGATHIPAVAREVYDVTGAGDTVIAALALALAAGASVLEGARLANYAAGLVVAKLGTAVVEPEELLASIAGLGREERGALNAERGTGS